MKILSFSIVLGLLLMVWGCKKVNEIVDSFTHFNFDTDYVVKVPMAPASPTPFEILTPEIATHSDVLFTAHKTRADLVEACKLTALDLSVKTPDSGDLNFLKSVDVYALADGLAQVRIAYKDAVPDNVGATLSLDMTGVDLTEYFKKTEYQLKIIVTTDEAVTQDYGVNAHAVFFVDAKILGE